MEDLKVEVGADISKFVNAMNAAGGSTEKFASDAAKNVTKVSEGLDKLQKKSYTARFAVQNLGNTIRDIPFAAQNPAILSTVLDHLVDSFANLKQEAGSTKGAFALLGQSIAGGGGLLIAFNLVSLAATYLIPKLFEASDAEKAAAESAKKLKDGLDGIFSEAGKEASEVSGLIAVLKNETETRQRKLDAIKELQKIQPEVFSGLTLEKGAVLGLDTAYQNYLTNLKTVIAAKIIEAELSEKITRLLKLQGTTETSGDQLEKLAKSVHLAGSAAGGLDLLQRSAFKNTKEITVLNQQIDGLNDKLQELSKGVTVVTHKGGATREIETIADVLAKLDRQIAEVSAEEIRLHTDEAQKKIQDIEAAISHLIDKFKLTAESPVIIELEAEIQGIKLEEYFKKVFKDLHNAPIPIPFEIQAGLQEEAKKLKEAYKTQFAPALQDAVKQNGLNISPFANSTDITRMFREAELAGHGAGKKFMAGLSGVEFEKFFSNTEKLFQTEGQILSSTLVDAISSIGEDIGKVLTGSIGGEQLFGDLFKVVGAALQQFGKALIEYGIGLKVLKLAFKSPALAIVAGIGLEILGAIMQSSVPKFASGGFVSGPGSSKSDSIHARLSAGEYVINAGSVNKYGKSFFDMINGGGFSRNNNFANGGSVSGGSIGGGLSIEVFGQFELQGTKLVAAVQRSQQSISRNG